MPTPEERLDDLERWQGAAMDQITELQETQARIIRALPDLTRNKKVDTLDPKDRSALERLKHLLGLER